jgi:ABC-type lipoprotein export system ATPase subunit
MDHLLELRDVSKCYCGPQPVQALAGVSLQLQLGEFVAVQGPSGSGKTTLLLVAGGLLAPDSGEVLLEGTNPYQLAADSRARFRAGYVGFVFQQFHLVPYLNVLENVLAPSIALPGSDARQRALELIERFGLTDRKHHVPAELSTGERQRVALARALLNRPTLVLADEPTGNLDRANAEIVLGHLAEFARSGEGAVLLVTHSDYAASFASRVERLEAGRLLAAQQQPDQPMPSQD